jgi:isoquinoline 1-oxidoreductase beta subunit
MRTENGEVLHDASRRSIGYGELAHAAALLEVPKDVALKDPKDFRLVGKADAAPRRRPTRSRVRRSSASTSERPGMLTALVAHPPVFGAQVKSVRSDRASAVAGVKKIVEVSSGVAVIATGFWPAKCARDLLEIAWDLGPNAGSPPMRCARTIGSSRRTPGLVAHKSGDVVTAAKSATRTLSADYELPYLAHAPMEPLNCVVDLRPDACEIWAGTQFQTVDHAARGAHGRARSQAGADPHHVHGRRLRAASQSRVRLHRRGGRDREGGRSAGQAHLDAR